MLWNIEFLERTQVIEMRRLLARLGPGGQIIWFRQGSGARVGLDLRLTRILPSTSLRI